MTDTTNHAEVIRNFLLWAKDDAGYGGPGDARVASEDAPKALDALAALTGELEAARMQALADRGFQTENTQLAATITTQAERIRVLEEALEFYAHRPNYDIYGIPRLPHKGHKGCTIPDQGFTARAALAPKEERP